MNERFCPYKSYIICGIDNCEGCWPELESRPPHNKNDKDE